MLSFQSQTRSQEGIAIGERIKERATRYRASKRESNLISRDNVDS